MRFLNQIRRFFLKKRWSEHWFAWLVMMVILIGMGTLYGCLWLTVLPQPTSVSNYRKFSEKRVEKMLSDIDDYGAHPVGSYACSEGLPEYITYYLEELDKEFGKKSAWNMTVITDKISREKRMNDVFYVYQDLTNIYVSLTPKYVQAWNNNKQNGLPAILISTNYDDLPNSLGTTRSLLGVSVLLDLIQTFLKTQIDIDKTRVIIGFMASGIEGNIGAYDFMNYHEWSNDILAYLLLEYNGVGGPTFAYQHNNRESSWLIKKYYSSMLRPYSSVIYKELREKAIGNEFDLANDYDYVKKNGETRSIPGLVLSSIKNSYLYNNPYSNDEFIDRGSVQYLGESLFKLSKDILESDYVKNYPWDSEGDEMIYHDLLLHTLWIVNMVGSYCIIGFLLLFTLVVPHFLFNIFIYWITVVASIGIFLCGVCFSFLICVIMSLIPFFNMFWNIHTWLSYMVYIPPGYCLMLYLTTAYRSAIKNLGYTGVDLEIMMYFTNAFIINFVILIVSVTGIRSGLVFALYPLFPFFSGILKYILSVYIPKMQYFTWIPAAFTIIPSTLYTVSFCNLLESVLLSKATHYSASYSNGIIVEIMFFLPSFAVFLLLLFQTLPSYAQVQKAKTFYLFGLFFWLVFFIVSIAVPRYNNTHTKLVDLHFIYNMVDMDDSQSHIYGVNNTPMLIIPHGTGNIVQMRNNLGIRNNKDKYSWMKSQEGDVIKTTDYKYKHLFLPSYNYEGYYLTLNNPNNITQLELYPSIEFEKYYREEGNRYVDFTVSVRYGGSCIIALPRDKISSISLKKFTYDIKDKDYYYVHLQSNYNSVTNNVEFDTFQIYIYSNNTVPIHVTTQYTLDHIPQNSKYFKEVNEMMSKTDDWITLSPLIEVSQIVMI